DKLVDDSVAQFLLAAREMMKQCALGGPRRLDDMIEAPALESVPVKLGEGGVEDLPPCRFRGLGCCCECHYMIHNTDQSVCLSREKMSNRRFRLNSKAVKEMSARFLACLCVL